MTLTLTIEDLEKYEAQVNKHYLNAMERALKALTRNVDAMYGSHVTNDVKAAIEAWEKIPCPRILDCLKMSNGI